MPEPTQINFDQLKVSCANCTLRELCIPQGMNADELKLIEGIIERKKPVHKNDYLFRAGDTNRALYAVLSGSIKTLVDNPNGEEQIVGFHLPGELLGMDGFSGDSHTCSAVALETSSVCEFPLESLDHVCHDVPSIQYAMRRIMGKEVAKDHAMLLLLGRMSAEEKLASFLISLSKRMAQRHWKPTEFHLTMPRQDIANYLGLAVETVSRLFAHLQDAGIIEVDRRRVNICDMAGLRAIVGENEDVKAAKAKQG
ncbi:MAG: fumarate/nitrate reduction transcriptional regulator Fnr [Gammaproteobacteria bacterium]|jgi:CRP/FNR family transcriptional regulator